MSPCAFLVSSPRLKWAAIITLLDGLPTSLPSPLQSVLHHDDKPTTEKCTRVSDILLSRPSAGFPAPLERGSSLRVWPVRPCVVTLRRAGGRLLLFSPAILVISFQFLELFPYFPKTGSFHILFPAPLMVFPACRISLHLLSLKFKQNLP